MSRFLEALREQRWDDHRYYHHSRINQSLHLLSAISFVCAYVLVFKNPAAAVLLAWLVGMTSRQIGHFFFEPRDYDEVNQATHEHKEEIKVGYNLQRKVVLMTIWALSPLALYLDPTLFGIFEPHASPAEFMHNVALMWLAIGARRAAVPHRAPVLPQGRADRPRVDDQDRHRPVPRHQALLQGAALPDARRADRSAARAHAARRRGRATDELASRRRMLAGVIPALACRDPPSASALAPAIGSRHNARDDSLLVRPTRLRDAAWRGRPEAGGRSSPAGSGA